MILPIRQIHLPLIDTLKGTREGVFFVGPLDKLATICIITFITSPIPGNGFYKSVNKLSFLCITPLREKDFAKIDFSRILHDLIFV